MDNWTVTWTVTWILALLLTVVIAFYKYYTSYFLVLKRMGIQGPTPVPILGTMISLMRMGIRDNQLELKKYGRVVGLYQGHQAVMAIYDVDILKQVLVKEAHNFTNRSSRSIKEFPIRRMITVLKNEHWKHVRSILTPTFSSGKLKKMTDSISRCAKTLLGNLEKFSDRDETFEFRGLCGAYTMDVIASTAFSVEIDSHNDPNNQFVRMAKKVFNFKATSPKILIMFCLPPLGRLLSKLGMTVFPRDSTEFFMSVINKAMEERNENTDQERIDFLQLMINARLDESDGSDVKSNSSEKSEENGEWNRKGLTHEEVLAQGLLFFLAGYETTANTMALLAYCLATNQECQDKLLKEIDDVTKNNKTLTYDLLQNIPYLEMCISETLRLYPAAPWTDRVANEDITINGLFIPKGMVIGVPIYALHHDPTVWVEPEKFNPERFSTEEKNERNPYYYLPFGVGPRNCIGMRLALMELKMSMAHILQNFKFVTSEETAIPLVLEKMATKSANGIKLKVEKRSQNHI